MKWQYKFILEQKGADSVLSVATDIVKLVTVLLVSTITAVLIA